MNDNNMNTQNNPENVKKTQVPVNSPYQSASAINKKQKDKKKWTVVMIVAIVLLVGCLVFMGYNMYREYVNKNNYSTIPVTSSKPPVVHIETDTESETDTEIIVRVDNPVNFEELQAINPDIYAWIKVPNTNVDYPILQHPTDDVFYLEHDAYTQGYLFAGSIYSEKVNSKDFKDPNTLLYGHNMLNGSMFATLHRYADQSFLDENPYFYIYTPGHILKYEIFSAYEYDNRHIMYSFDFKNKDVFKDYLEMATNPNSIIVTTRDVEVTVDDTIVTLSTCTDYRPNNRYLVQGVLIDDQATW